MFNSIFGKILYQRRFFLLFWFIGIAFITGFTMSFYHSFSGGDLGQAFDNLPAALQQIAGNADSFKSVDGYISQQLFALRVPIITVILAIALFHGLVVGEEQKGVSETQLTLPISRTRLMAEKLLAGFAILILASFGAVVGTLICLVFIGESYSAVELIQKSLSCLTVVAVFGMLSFMLGGLTGKRALSLGFASGFTFLCYLINSMASSVSSLANIDKFLPFYYYKPTEPTDWSNVALLVGVSLVFAIVGILGFNKRDLQSRG